MVCLADVLVRIAEVAGGYSGRDPIAAMEEYWQHSTGKIRLSITADVIQTEQKYEKNYGKRNTAVFRLKDYDHGKQLASELFYMLKGQRPDMSGYTGELFAPTDPLYLFVHMDH